MANKHIKRSSTSLIIKKCQPKLQSNTTSCPLGWLLSNKPQQKPKPENNKGVKKLEPFCTVDGNVKWCSYYRKYKFYLKIELSYDPAIPLLGI